ncbi:MAG: hypothetical protein ACYC6Y_28855, partial [Thermoguttaceae bacterium]
AWASWNYHLPADAGAPVALTYDVNRLQGLGTPGPVCVTLNWSDRIDDRHVLKEIAYEHPVFTPGAVAAQQRHGEVSGVRRLHFCGAYWGYGFHEDGVNSALAVCRKFGIGLDHLATGPLPAEDTALAAQTA